MTETDLHARDIPDELFLRAVRETAAFGHPDPDGTQWRMRGDVQQTLEQIMGAELPEKLFLAKARILIDRRGVLHGCTCGCRGDYHVPGNCGCY